MDLSREQFAIFRSGPATLDIRLETEVAKHATRFFSPVNYQAVCSVLDINRGNAIRPLSGEDFLRYVVKKGTLPDPGTDYTRFIRHLLERMAAANILVEMGTDGSNRNILIPKFYYAFNEVPRVQFGGDLWLAKALGPRFVHRQLAPAVVHITGSNSKGNVSSGSGIVIDPRTVLTCKHVTSQMNVDPRQRLQGKHVEVDIKNILEHEELDIAVLRVTPVLKPVSGLALRAPMVMETVYAFGYPKIPNVRPRSPDSQASYLIARKGEVTNEHVVATQNSDLFLYSAIARPGDSGGPIVSEDGYLVGITTELTDGRYEGEDIFSPHYAGVPAQGVAKAMQDMELGVQIGYESADPVLGSRGVEVRTSALDGPSG